MSDSSRWYRTFIKNNNFEETLTSFDDLCENYKINRTDHQHIYDQFKATVPGKEVEQLCALLDKKRNLDVYNDARKAVALKKVFVSFCKRASWLRVRSWTGSDCAI